MLLDCLNVDVTVTRALLQHVVGLRKKKYIFKTDAIDQNNPYNKIYQCQRSFHFFLENIHVYKMFGYILKNSNRVQPKRYCTDWNEQAEQNKKQPNSTI